MYELTNYVAVAFVVATAAAWIALVSWWLARMFRTLSFLQEPLRKGQKPLACDVCLPAWTGTLGLIFVMIVLWICGEHDGVALAFLGWPPGVAFGTMMLERTSKKVPESFDLPPVDSL